MFVRRMHETKDFIENLIYYIGPWLVLFAVILVLHLAFCQRSDDSERTYLIAPLVEQE